MLVFFRNIEKVREQVKPGTVIQGVILSGGEAMNVIPRKAVADLAIRFPVDRDYLEKVTDMVHAAAKAAAEATETEVEISVYGRYFVGISLSTLHDLGFRFASLFEATGLSDEPDPPEGWMISQWVPGLGLQVQTFASGTPGHSQEMADASIKPLAHKGMIVAAKTLAAVGYELMTSPETRARAVEEHRKWRDELARRGWLEDMRTASWKK